MTSEGLDNWLKFFASIAPVFESRFVEPLRSRYPHAEEDPWQSLGVFLEGYAFEHQGSDRSFGHAAGEVIEKFLSQPLAGVAAQKVWKRFCKEFRNKSPQTGLNTKVNPLAPKGERYKMKGKSYKTTKLSVIEFAKGRETIEGKPLAAWAKSGLRQGNETKKIHDMLCTINGVGPKIASLFLRDVAIRYELAPKDARFLLQPIDTWVRRCVECLNSNGDSMSAHECAKWITDHAMEPEAVNQGMWYYAAHVARSEYRLKADLSDLPKARERFREHCRSLQQAASAWNKAGRVQP